MKKKVNQHMHNSWHAYRRNFCEGWWGETKNLK